MLTYRDIYIFARDYGQAFFEVLVLIAILKFYSNSVKFWRFIDWVREAKYVILACGLIAISIVIAAIFISLGLKPAEHIIRHTGLALQLFGTATVIWGILNTRNDFKLEPLSGIVNQWYKRCPLLPQSGYFQVDSLACRARITAPGLYVTYSPGDKPTIESVADAMMKNIDALHKQIADVDNTLQTKLQDIVEQEELARREEADKIRQELLATATGGLHISAIGAVWLMFGILLGTASPEISSFLI